MLAVFVSQLCAISETFIPKPLTGVELGATVAVAQHRVAVVLGECGPFVQHSVTEVYEGNEEGLPAAIQEAMARGMAVVSTRHSGIADAVIEGETGLPVDEGDVQGMAKAFLAVPALASGLGAAGYRRAASLYRGSHEKARLRAHVFPDERVAA